MTKGITREAIKVVLREMFLNGEEPKDIVNRMNLWHITDPWELIKTARVTVWDNIDLSHQYVHGKEKVLNTLIGKAMKHSNFRMDADSLKIALKISLREYKNSLQVNNMV